MGMAGLLNRIRNIPKQLIPGVNGGYLLAMTWAWR